MTEGLIPEPVYKLLAPESVSHGVVFLASDDAVFVSGTGIAVDGGRAAD